MKNLRRERVNARRRALGLDPIDGPKELIISQPRRRRVASTHQIRLAVRRANRRRKKGVP